MHKPICVMPKTMGIACSGESVVDIRTYNKVCKKLRDIEETILKENLLSMAKLYESDGVWTVVDNRLQKVYWRGRLVNLIK